MNYAVNAFGFWSQFVNLLAGNVHLWEHFVLLHGNDLPYLSSNLKKRIVLLYFGWDVHTHLGVAKVAMTILKAQYYIFVQ